MRDGHTVATIRHGTGHSYRKHKCRCDLCRRALTMEARKKNRKPLTDPYEPQEIIDAADLVTQIRRELQSTTLRALAWRLALESGMSESAAYRALCRLSAGQATIEARSADRIICGLGLEPIKEHPHG